MLHSRLLRYIDEVARTGSIRRAAEHLNVASSAINRQILAYEQDLGRPIFERLPRGVRLTTTGEMLVEHIRGTLKDHDRLLKRVSDLKAMRRTTITIATLEALTADVVAQVSGAFHETHPFTKIVVASLPASQIVKTVLSGEAQLGLGFDLETEANIRVYSNVRCSLGVVLGSDHPLASRLSIRLSDCVGHAFVLPSEALTIRQMLNRALQKANVTLHPVVESNSIDLLKRLVTLSNVGTVLTRADVEMERLRGHMVFVPIVGGQNEFQSLTMIQRKSADLDPATALYATELAQFISQIGDK